MCLINKPIAEPRKTLIGIDAVEPLQPALNRKGSIGAWRGRFEWPLWEEWKRMDADIEAEFRAAIEAV